MKRAARAAPPSIGAAVIWAAKPPDVALETADEAALAALDARLETDEARDDAPAETEEAADEAEPEMDEAADEAEPETDDAAPPTAVRRVDEPMVEVATALLPDEMVVRIAAAMVVSKHSRFTTNRWK